MFAARSLCLLRSLPFTRYASTEAATSSLSVAGSASIETQSGAPVKHVKPLGSRPHLGVEIDPNHGLWAFFRKNVDSEGKVTYETVEPRDSYNESGRSWIASELRRKSFKDLHTLWYVLLRERNLLATQREEARRIGIRNTESLVVSVRDRLCRKSMARLKYVINERRLVYDKIVAAGEDSAKDAPKKITDPFYRVKSRRRALPREVR
ncbi:mitochondrial 39-S ribosomal protein L47 (MRP-L47)-domain-containing protein [Pisolithus microcarpus]|nr:mitochondrial 39-S ribosomal protein L47 (MRP-L47)-domain-containing protein [Pisolithus microcarpus]